MPKKFTIHDVRQYFKKVGLELLDNVYINAHTYMNYRCLTCGYIGTKKAYIAKAGHGCPKCDGKLKYNLEKAKKEFSKANLRLVSDSYKNSSTKMPYVCNVCGHKGEKTLSSIVHLKQGCPKCAINNSKLDIQIVKNRFKKLSLTLLSENYTNTYSKMKYSCDVCGYIGYKNVSDVTGGYGCPKCADKKQSLKLSGKNSSFWKGGVQKNNLPLYSTYAKQLHKYMKVYKIKKEIEGNTLELLGVRCYHCGKVFVPKLTSVKNKIGVITGKGTGEQNLYCSDKCKKDCVVFGQKKYPKGFKKYNYRANQKDWSELVKNNSKQVCEICGNYSDKLVSHHEIPVKVNPIISADIDNGIVLCDKCHKKVHQLPWCTLNYLRNCKNKGGYNEA